MNVMAQPLFDHVGPERSLWHSDQGSRYGAKQTRAALLEKGFIRSISRAS